MGGFGSGRWGFGHRRKTTVEECHTLDFPKLVRDRLIGGSDPRSRQIVWRRIRDGEVTATVGYRWEPVEGDLAGVMHLNYTVNGTPVTDRIPVESTPGNVGGRYWYARCPNCNRRVRKLYLAPRETHFACRQCNDLTYECNLESRKFQSLNRLLAAQMGITQERARRLMNELGKPR